MPTDVLGAARAYNRDPAMRPPTDTSSYVIDGGRSGAARLAVLARVRASASEDFVRRAGLRPGDRCLDLGCGSGELTMRLAELAAPGEVVGIDFDPEVVAVARERAAAAEGPAPRFVVADVEALPSGLGAFDLISARYVLGHLRDPFAALRSMWALCRPGGVVAVEDTDAAAMSSEPHSAALERCIALHRELALARGLVPGVGAQLAGLVERAGFAGVEDHVEQEIRGDRDAKRLTELTLERTRAALTAEGLVTDAEIDALLVELRAFSADPHSIVRSPRLHQVIGRRPPSASEESH
jgi:SAM-dependent methyltransferase